MKAPPWTDAERERLLALKAAGLKNVAIAAALTRSPTSVGTQLYALRHPERLRERQAERYRAERPRLVAAHRAYYAANREQVLARQAERRREAPEHIRSIRRASHGRNLARHCEAQKARNALAKARAGDGRHLGKLAGIAPEDALFWLPRLPPVTARAAVAKLREIAAIQDECRPMVRRILNGERTGEPRRGDFGVVVPFGPDRG